MTTTRPRRLRPHRIAAIACALGIGATCAITGVTQEILTDNAENLLSQQASQAAMVLDGYLGQSLAAVSGLGKTVAASHADPALFPAQVRAAGMADDYYTGEALLKVAPSGTVTVVAHTGRISLDLADPALEATARKQLATPGMHQLGLGKLGPLATRGLLFGAPFAPTGYAIYAETLVMPAVDLSSFANMPFSNLDIAVYLDTPDADHAWIRTTHPVATSGLRAVAVIPTADSTDVFPQATLTSSRTADSHLSGHLFLVASPRGSLLSASSNNVLLTMLLIGCLSTLVSSGMLELACRRRDRAMTLVRELTRKNAELDEALIRQAEAEESLRRAQRMEAVGQLAGGIAHDFNNLLAVILSYSGFVADALPDAGPLREDLDEVTKAARRGAELTRQLLLFSRRDAAVPVAVDVNDRVHDLGRMLRRTIGEDVRLRTDLGPSPLVVQVGTGELDQVIMNLAVNARDAMPNGGEIVVSTGRTPTGDVLLTLSDTGVGMTPEQIDRAFEPFYTTKEPGRGTGLGLSSVYGIVTRWGGTIGIASSRGQGTTVTIVLPRCDEEGAAAELPGAALLAPSGATVLLVEDEPAVLSATRRLLADAGYEVIAAPDGPAALAAFDRAVVDVVVTDVVMPGGMSGPALVEALRERRPGFPAVFVSGYPRDLITERGFVETDIPLVEKPFADESLLAAIARSLHTVEALA